LTTLSWGCDRLKESKGEVGGRAGYVSCKMAGSRPGRGVRLAMEGCGGWDAVEQVPAPGAGWGLPGRDKAIRSVMGRRWIRAPLSAHVGT